MNEQFGLEPIDPIIRAQLTRRSAGRVPDELMDEVTSALDSGRRPRTARWPSLAWTTPRLAGAGIAVAIVSILVFGVAMPASRPAATSGMPGLSLAAGYPAERALTTAELAAILAGPPLPTNTALVATVTIDLRSDVCPMNRYPTLGVLAGMDSQVCVVGTAIGGMSARSGGSVEDSGGREIDWLNGTYAFRYLAPGYLGFIDFVDPASDSQLAFHVADAWPQPTGTLLVSGYMTQLRLPASDPGFCTGVSPAPAGDPLNPNGKDPCVYTWLSDTASEVPTWHDDGLTVPPEARLVDAAGAGLIDNIPDGVTVYGVFIVRWFPGPCVGYPINSLRPCQAFRILARVSDLSGSEAQPSSWAATPTTSISATPIDSPSPSSGIALPGLIGPDNTPLTASQLADLIAADPARLHGRYVIDTRVTCDGIDCTGVAPKAVADLIQADGSIGLVGPLDLRPDGGIVWTVPQATATWDNRFIFIVDATMFGNGDATYLDSDAAAELTAQNGAYYQFAPEGSSSSVAIQGLFLVRRIDTGKTCEAVPTAAGADCSPQVEIIARIMPATLP